ncbi:MAG: 2-succinyl-5-enolpyruvyl-6-hydroxy-3-cyclohexene-1-carboxylic-acid synthase [Chroococcales cyanobacterium]
MSLDFRNTNTLWASTITETLKSLGLKTAIICPGSRSAPLTVAFAQTPEIEAIPIVDERSAAFFALGIAKRSGVPVALVCTSGTAGANFYPAVIEAKESQIPLLILTGDRPPELRNCHAGQTIDQLKLYGHYPNWQAELATPMADVASLRYVRQTVIQAFMRSQFPSPGVVHLNCPFRDPLIPVAEPHVNALRPQISPENFFEAVNPSPTFNTDLISCPTITQLAETWSHCQRGLIIVGIDHSRKPWDYCRAIARLSEALEWPVLADALSPLRNYAGLNPNLIATYDLILRNRELAKQLTPEMVIQLGELPTSKELRAWLDETQPQRWVINSGYENLDPLHGKTTHLRLSPEPLINTVLPQLKRGRGVDPANLGSEYLRLWCKAENQIRQSIDTTMKSMDTLLEGKAAWVISHTLPAATPVFIANSMPIRDAEFFWTPKNSGIQPFVNRGANGIDGTLSTALGIAHRYQSSVLLTGDLALLHDTNGFLIRNKFVGHLTIIVINNNGGGIFEVLPISQFDPPFEEFFATPQNIEFEKLAATYGIEYQLIESWEQLETLLNPLPETGIRLLELRTDRKVNAKWLQDNLGKFASEL